MSTAPTSADRMSVAIVGLAGRFPGAANVDVFWRNVAAGVRSIRGFSDEQLLAAGVDPALLRHPRYVKAGTIIEGIDEFDADFFGYPPREAELIDPQHRLFLECAWEALEDAGYAPYGCPGLVGVFAGAGPSAYASDRVSGDVEQASSTDPHYRAMHNAPDSLASTVSYKLNLRGPSIAVQTFCSTSLVAAHLACQSLLTYDCGLALAGGVVIGIPQGVGYVSHEGGILSPDGHCRSFDARAAGSVMGSGLGIVVLKRLTDARADGDHIYAVVRGSAVNNDGVRKVGYTAPSVAGQAAVIATALSRAGVHADTIGYVEAHGTATALGDAVELDAMTQAFRRGTAKTQFCGIGSVKANIGHLDRAAGVAGLIKTALALDRKMLPPSSDFKSASPDVALDQSPFYVNTALRPWPDGEEPRRACVSSFGAGGTNAHMVLEEAPPRTPVNNQRSAYLLVLSARTESALEVATANLATHLRRHPDADLADVAWTLMAGRTVFNHRRAVVCASPRDAAEVLASKDPARVATVTQFHRKRSAMFHFGETTGQEQSSALLYMTEPVYREAVDSCRAIVGIDAPTAAAFESGYALARLMTSWGVTPRACVGDGSGQYVAACVEGLLALSEAMRLAADASRKAQTEASPIVLAPQEHEMVVSFGALAEARTSAWARTVPRSGDAGLLLAEFPVSGDAASYLAGVLRGLAQLWLADVPLDWAAMHSLRARRVSLPRYPFERQRYWRMPDATSALPSSTTTEPERKNNLSDWFWLPSWKRIAPGRTELSAHRWLILTDDCGVGERLADWLMERGHVVETATAARGDASLDPRAIRPATRVDYERVLREAARHGGLPDRIVHLWTVSPGATDATESDALLLWQTTVGFASVMALTQALTNVGVETCEIAVVSTGLYDVDAGDVVCPSKTTVLGVCKVIPQECAGFCCRNIDITLPVDDQAVASVVERLGEELLSATPGDAIALRGPHRWAQTFEPVHVPAEGMTPTLRRGGVYLITGGLGGIGLAMAEHLADTVQARLALVGRTALPPRETWAELVALRGDGDLVARRVRILQALEARGIEVLILQADVSVESKIRAAVQQTLDRFGSLHGVLHAAGTPGSGLVSVKSIEAATQVLAPKVSGTVALSRALEGVPLDFLVLFSSVTSIVGGPGQADYSAANNFLEAFARRHRDAHGVTVAISWSEWLWDAWQEGLRGFPEPIRTALVAHRKKYGVSFEEGAEVVRRALAARLPHVYVATFDLHRLVADNRTGLVANIVEQAGECSDRRAHYARPMLANSFIAPTGTHEERIAAIWRDVLGIEPVGIDDNFFELGGNSLLGMQVMARLQKALGADIAVRLLYEAPTVRALAEHFGGDDPNEARVDRVAEQWRARSEKRNERFRQLRSS